MESPAGPLQRDPIVAREAGARTGPGVAPDGERLLTRSFLLVIAGTSASWLAHGIELWAISMVVIELGFDPALGGLGLGLVAGSGVLSRLVVGPLTDRRGGRSPAIAGCAVLVASGLSYLAGSSGLVGGWTALALVGIGAALQGVGFGTMTTSTFAVVGEVTPARRRGEGVGYYGALQPIVQGLAAALAFALVDLGGFGLLYGTVAVAAALAVVLFAALRPGPPVARAQAASLGATLTPELIVPVVVCGAFSFVGGALVLTVPVLGLGVGISNPGVFYLANAVSGVAARLTTGRLSDRWGRTRVAIPGLLLLSASLAALVVAAEGGLAVFVVTGATYGLAAAIALPAIQALLLDRTPPARRGLASAAMGMAFDIGFGVGSIVIGAVIGLGGAGAGLLASAAAPMVAIGLLAVDARPRERSR